MDHEIAWCVELELRPENLDQFRKITQEMVQAASQEHGTMIYERYLDESGTRIFIYERYVSEAAAVAHLEQFNKLFTARWSEMVKRKQFIVFGYPNTSLKVMLDRLGATYFKRVDGISRLLVPSQNPK